MTCPYCNGTMERVGIVIHSYTNKPKTCSIPCVCFTSTVISQEYKLLKHLGDQFEHPDKISKNLAFLPEDLGKSPNLIIRGDYDTLLFSVKALLMKYRFDVPKPRILFSRAIDVVHDYHVPHGDEASLHLSATEVFDLVIVVFGTNETNKAVAPCMAQLVGTRLDNKKPTWVYLPASRPTLQSCTQEYSEELNIMLSSFSEVEVKGERTIDRVRSESKNKAAGYKPK